MRVIGQRFRRVFVVVFGIVLFNIDECDVFRGAVFFLLLLRDDDISPFIDVLEDFHAVDVVELSMIDDHLLMTDYINISTKVIIYSGRCSLLSYTVTIESLTK